MRVSADKSDPCYFDINKYGRLRVYLDGVEQFGVVTADEEMGYIRRIMFDGRAVRMIGGEVDIRMFTGKVRITKWDES